jgi:Uma2 family endonuclease
MSTRSASEPDIVTMADLLKRLGNISPHRVRWHPLPGTATVADVVEMGARENRLCELIDGVLVEKAMGFRESLLALALSGYLREFVVPRNLGLLVGPDGMLQLFPGLIRIPDVAFIAWASIPGGRVPTKPVPQLTPDLAVEILSSSNTRDEMARKRREYFQARVRAIWEIDPDARTVSVYTSGDDLQVLSSSGTLQGDPVLPGFSLPLHQLFSELDRHVDS